MDDEIALKRKLVEATNAVRKKFNKIKSADTQNAVDLEKFYEPISKPLTSISNVVTQQKPNKKKAARSRSFSTSSPETQQKLLEPQETSTPITQKSTLFETPSSSSYSTLSSPSTFTNYDNKSDVEEYFSGMRLVPSQHDTTYGVHYGTKVGEKLKTFIGNAEVRFRDRKVSLYKNNKNIAAFDGSRELYELLFLKNPPIMRNLKDIDTNLLQTYKKILQLTNAVYKKYDEKQGLMETRWVKYLRLIKPLITDGPIGAGIKRTNTSKIGLPLKKRLSSKNPEYIYWNKPKELVNRLRLLWSSKMAGHSGHDNEIMSIIEELREEGLIY